MLACTEPVVLHLLLEQGLLLFEHISVCFRACKAWKGELQRNGFCTKTACLCLALARKVTPTQLLERLRAQTKSRSHQSLSKEELEAVQRFLRQHHDLNHGTVHQWLQFASQEPYCSFLSKGVQGMEWMFKREVHFIREFAGKAQPFDPMEMQTLRGFRGFVTAVAFSHDSSALVSEDSIGTLKVWGSSSENGLRKEVKRISLRGSGSVRCMAVSPDGLIACVDSSKDVKVLTLTGQLQGVLQGHTYQALCVAWCPNRNTSVIATGGTDYGMRLWCGSQLTLLRIVCENTAMITHVAWSNDGKLLASASKDGSICVCDLSGAPKARYRHRMFMPRHLSWSPDGTHLASSDNSGRIVVWSMSHDSGGLTKTLLVRDAVHCITWSPNGRWIAAACHDDTVRLLAMTGGGEDVAWKVKGGARCLAWSHDGSHLAGGGNECCVKVWHVSGRGSISQDAGQEAACTSAAAHGGAKRVCPSTASVEQLLQQDKDHSTHDDAEQGSNTTGVDEDGRMRHGCCVSCVALSDEASMGASTAAGHLMIWNMHTRACVREYKFRSCLYSMAFNHACTMLAATGGYESDDGAGIKCQIFGIHLSEDKHSQLRVIETASQPSYSLTFAPDDSKIAVTQEFRGTSWFNISGEHQGMSAAEHGAPTMTLRGDIAHVAACWTPDGRLFAVHDQRGGIALVDTETDLVKLSVHASSHRTSACTCASDDIPRYTRTAIEATAHCDACPLTAKLKHECASLGVSPDGSLLASTFNSDQVQVWDMTGRMRFTLPGNLSTWALPGPAKRLHEAGASADAAAGGAAGGDDGDVRLTMTEDAAGASIITHGVPHLVTALSHMIWVHALELAPDASLSDCVHTVGCFCAPSPVTWMSCAARKILAGCIDGHVLCLALPPALK